jgi:acyl-CoA synthetase (NDP forming)
MAAGMHQESRNQLDRLFMPRGLALFGGAAKTGSFGQLIILSQIRYGYQGRLYPISDKGGEIDGHRVYRCLDDVDGPVDLASISVPARLVPEILNDCLKHGLAGAQVHSSGFAETGEPEGIALQNELIRIAGQGLRIIGPNCFGIHCPKGGITLLPGADFSRRPGSVALISQSGGIATEFAHEAAYAGLGISKIISYGNGCDLESTDFLAYLADDPDTKYIAAYLEGPRDARAFFRILKATTPRKPVIVWKGGLTRLGGRAARSHTGSLAGEAGIWDSALKQAGAIRVQGLDEMMDALMVLAHTAHAGKRIALLGGGGAIGVFSSDLAERYGLDVPLFSPETRKRLRTYFPTPGNSMANPLDTGSPALPVEVIRDVSREILIREPVETLILIMLLRTLEVEMPMFHDMLGLDAPPPGSYLESLVEPLAELKAETGKNIIMVLENHAYRDEDLTVEGVYRATRRRFLKAHIPVFPSVERALRGLCYTTTVSTPEA